MEQQVRIGQRRQPALLQTDAAVILFLFPSPLLVASSFALSICIDSCTLMFNFYWRWFVRCTAATAVAPWFKQTGCGFTHRLFILIFLFLDFPSFLYFNCHCMFFIINYHYYFWSSSIHSSSTMHWCSGTLLGIVTCNISQNHFRANQQSTIRTNVLATLYDSNEISL